MTDKYHPISCDFHDTLQVLSLRCKRCVIEYRDLQGTVCTVESVIEDVYAQRGEEFLRLDSGMVIRLDRLIVVDGKRLQDFC